MNPSAQIPEGSVVITPIEMYREQQATHTTMLNVVSKIDSLTDKLDHSLEDQSKRIEAIDGKDGILVKHDSRLTALERWRWKSAGVAAVISAAGAAGGTALIMRAVTGH